MPDRYAVIGNPVAHSKSPLIHAAFARQTGQDISYAGILAPLHGFSAAADDFKRAGGMGLNVTLPFKHDAWRYATAHVGFAMDAEAVNTIKFDGRNAIGHNTDGLGLVTDLERNVKFPIRGKRILLMGAGGATYGVMRPILDAHPDLLVVANRTFEKASRLVAHFQRFAKLALHGVSAKPYPHLAGSQFDLVINATSAGVRGEMPELPDGVFAPGALAYDMMYGAVTPFMKFASGRAASVADGLGMLVEQAAESFFIWRGVRPETAPVIAMLRSEK
jgi:shikimate dehydrogenase